MLAKILSAIIGSRIDRRDGRGGFKGAMMGYAGAALAKRILPAGLIIGGGLAAKRMLDRKRTDRA